MAEFPGGTYNPRTKENKPGVIFDAAKTKICFAEDITKLDAEVVAIEDFLLPQYISAHIAAVIAVAVAGTWVDIPFDEEVSTPKTGIVHDHESSAEEFTITKDGVYRITFSISVEDSAVTPDSHIEARVVNDGSEIFGSLTEVDISGTPQSEKDHLVHNSFLVTLEATDIIKFEFTSDKTTISLNAHAAYGDHKDTAIISIERIA